ncbi:hypothetical protein [Burkholderia cenocepacia]|uniref:hypothetical protein n=1 Tax=Burkholderia cenocepacia TaxID=95486 RepID=UPI002237D1D7|nr:hypothetical protein [Burkholderia cenocepacia]MCW5140672.1 hypothetical protein [Burkholderia cenocepacia]
MPSSPPFSALEQLVQEESHFAQAPNAFFDAWKQGVRLAGPQFFGDGQRDALAQARNKWDLEPDLPCIGQALGVMSSGERVFIAALVSFYNAHDSQELLRRAGVEGLADLGSLDLQRRRVIASLLLHYTGW